MLFERREKRLGQGDGPERGQGGHIEEGDPSRKPFV